MTRVSNLLRLSIIDAELEEKTKRSLAIEEQLVSDPVTAAAQAAADEEQKRLTHLRADLHARELEAKGLDARIKDLEQRLYGGRVQNPTELDGIQKQAQMLKRQRSSMDDQLLELMESIDESQRKFDTNAKALAHAQGDRAGDIERLSRERDALVHQIGDLDASREQVRGSMDAEAMRVYDHLHRKSGRAVAPIKRDACSLCGVSVPTGQVQRVHAGNDIVFCSGCGRILAS